MNEETFKPEEMIEEFSEALSNSFFNVTETERFKTAKASFIDDIWQEVEFSVIDQMAIRLEWFVRDMANQAVNALLKGQPQQVTRYLKLDGYTGRTTGAYGENVSHEVIHGRLSEGEAITLRREIAQANADLIQNERIKDLEDQVKSLVEQINKKDDTIQALRDQISERY